MIEKMISKELRDMLHEAGLKDSQINTKTGAIFIDLLTNQNGKFIELKGVCDAIEKANYRLEYLKSEFAREERKHQAKYEKWTKRFYEQQEYIKGFNEGLQQMETESARDAMKTAQVFVNTVNIRTAYDNTAFINGLTAILANKQVKGVDGFKKIENEAEYPFKGTHQEKFAPENFFTPEGWPPSTENE